MTPREVRKLIETEIADDWAVTNSHGLDLCRSLVEPCRVTIIERSVKKGRTRDQDCVVWLVLVEQAENDDGYRIVMKEDGPIFGLASRGLPSDQHLVLCGWYGNFMATFLGM